MINERIKNKVDISDFSILRKQTKPSYSNVVGSLNSLRNDTLTSISRMRGVRGEGSVLDLSSFVAGDQLDKFFKNPMQTKHLASLLSDTLYATTPIYAGIIDYFKDMYCWRYTVTPRRIKNTVKNQNFEEVYKEMLDIAEGMSIETILPKIILNLFKNGEAFIYTSKDNPTKTVQTTFLPRIYSRATTNTQHGTLGVEFDLYFFKQLGLREEQLQEFLKLFPKEIQEYYNSLSGKIMQGTWVSLNPKYSTCFRLNEAGFPTYLNTFYDLIDYKTYKINELDRSSNMLERILVQEVDLSKDDNLTLTEVESLHNNLTAALQSSRGTMLITSIGKVHTEYLQPDVSKENKTLMNAFTSIYDNAGLNHYIFGGDSAEAINTSIQRDLRTVWNHIESIVKFYVLTINNLYNFHDYQMSFKLLPISLYNSETMNSFRQNAEYGVGKLDFIVASGIKQVDLDATLELEEYLNLSERLVPLASSHTLSSTKVEEKTETTEEVQTDEQE